MLACFLAKKWLSIIGFNIVLILGFIFFYFKKPTTVTPTIAVTKGTIVDQSEAVGYIKKRHFSTVKSQVDGIVEIIYHDEGEYITKGTPLVKVKSAPAPQEYALRYQELANAISEEKEAEIVFNRYKQLLKNQIIPNNYVEYTTAQDKYNVAKNNKILAEQKLALLERGETLVGNNRIDNIIVSPTNGYILYRNIDIGDPVISISSAQTATQLFIVADMQQLMFQGSVDERDVAKIKIGMVAKIKIGSLPQQEITGKISRIALQSNRENAAQGIQGSSDQSPFSVGFKIEITDLQLPKDLILRSGYSATATIQIKKVDGILILPLRLIQFKDTKPYVLLPTRKNGEPQQQQVELGVSDDINVEIKSGLKLGDEVIDQPDISTTTQN